MTIKSFSLAWIVVNDFKKAMKYYTDTLGLKVLNVDENFGWAELSGQEGGAVIGIAQKSDHEPMPAGSNAVITLDVKDIEKSKAELAKKGIKMVGEIMEVPGHVKLQMFTDADGNRMQLVQKL